MHNRYKIKGQTDFNHNYSFGGELSWNYPFKGKISIFSLNFDQTRILEDDYFQRNIGLLTRYYLRFAPLELIAKVSHQRLNEQNNLGVGFGLQKQHMNVYYGFRVDYFQEYYNYSVFLQSYIYKHKLNIRLVYDRIDGIDFFNIGLNYLILR